MSVPAAATKISRIVLRDLRGAGGSSTDAVSITTEGDLRFDGYDTGEAPRVFWGRDEYEFWRIVKSGWKDTLLLALLADRFGSIAEITTWLDSRGVPYESDRWIGGDR